jgi:thiamine biosynthesis protein ThiS
MRILVNGDGRECGPGTTVADLLDALGLRSGAVVIERNGTILAREAIAVTPLAEGDALEIVRLVGGG